MRIHTCFKGLLASVFTCAALTLPAQTLREMPNGFLKSAPVRNVVQFPTQGKSMLTLQDVMKTGQPVVKRGITRDVTSGKPGTFYTVSNGVYNLVPGYYLDHQQTIVSEGGVLGYIDRELYFKNATPEYDQFMWVVGSTVQSTDSVGLRIYPSASTNFINVETPKLTAALSGRDSTYQMGAYYNSKTSSIEPGMIVVSGGAYVYNVDADASPFADTYFITMSETDSWSKMGFGSDAETKSTYVEMFEKPLGGSVALQVTSFYVVSPSTEDLSSAQFEVDWVQIDGMESKVVKSFTAKPVHAGSFGDTESVWSVTVYTDVPVVFTNEFYIHIAGPQNGEKWALFHQISRGRYGNAQKNTAYTVPSVGENAGVMIQYVGYNNAGEEIPYNTSLDIHTYMITPYILLANSSQQVQQTDAFDFNLDGENRTFLMRDWMGSPNLGVVVSAKISESTDGDWLTVTSPTVASGAGLSDFFSMNIKAEALPFLVEGRRATITLSDNYGFSREIVIYQGDRESADMALGVQSIDVQGKVFAIYRNGNFELTYPSVFNNVQLYTLDGRLLNTELLSESGTDLISAETLPNGVYVLKFLGEDNRTVKVTK